MASIGQVYTGSSLFRVGSAFPATGPAHRCIGLGRAVGHGMAVVKWRWRKRPLAPTGRDISARAKPRENVDNLTPQALKGRDMENPPRGPQDVTPFQGRGRVPASHISAPRFASCDPPASHIAIQPTPNSEEPVNGIGWGPARQDPSLLSAEMLLQQKQGLLVTVVTGRWHRACGRTAETLGGTRVPRLLALTHPRTPCRMGALAPL